MKCENKSLGTDIPLAKREKLIAVKTNKFTVYIYCKNSNKSPGISRIMSFLLEGWALIRGYIGDDIKHSKS